MSGFGSPYVSVSSSQSWVEMYTKNSLLDSRNKATIYVVAPGPSFISTREVLQGHLPPDIDDQQEYAASGGIPIGQIIGYDEYKKVRTTFTKKNTYQARRFQTNNRYDSGQYPLAIYPPNFALAGFPGRQTKRETTAPASGKGTPKLQVEGKSKNTEQTSPSGQVLIDPQSSSRPGVKGATSKLPEVAYFDTIKMLKAKGYKVPFNPKQSTMGRPKIFQSRPTSG